MKGQDLRSKADTVMMQTYARFPLVLVKGKGCVVWDMEGRSYKDFIAGIAVCNLGHAHPGVIEALKKGGSSELTVIFTPASNNFLTGCAS